MQLYYFVCTTSFHSYSPGIVIHSVHERGTRFALHVPRSLAAVMTKIAISNNHSDDDFAKTHLRILLKVIWLSQCHVSGAASEQHCMGCNGNDASAAHTEL